MEIAHVRFPSLVDYPGKVAAVAWTVGCNLRCPFCYNAELVIPERAACLPRQGAEEVLPLLAARAKLLDGVVVTGGEPTLHPDLPSFLGEVKGRGLLVKLDTNGTRPEVVGHLLAEGLVDYVALDLKAPFSRYPEFAGVSLQVAWVQKTLAVMQNLAPDHEVRTTVAPGLTADDLLAIAREVQGARRYILQPFVLPEGKRLVDESWRGRPALGVEELRELLPEIGKYVSVEIRA